jgi:hypothetical protein
MSKFDTIQPPEKQAEWLESEIERLIASSALSPEQIKRVLERISSKQRSAAESPESIDIEALRLTVLRSDERGEPKQAPAGRIEGKWIGRKEILANRLQYDAPMYRGEIRKLARILNIETPVMNVLEKARNDDPFILDLDLQSGGQELRINTLYVKEDKQQEFFPESIGQIKSPPPELTVNIDENSRPFRLIVRGKL